MSVNDYDEALYERIEELKEQGYFEGKERESAGSRSTLPILVCLRFPLNNE